MELKLNIDKLRGTIFTKQINYSPDFVNALSGVLVGYIPSFLTVLPQNNPNAVIPNFWEMVNPTTGEHIQFNNAKIDIIINSNTPYSNDVIIDFAKHCSMIFEKILSITGQNSNRLAIAPTFSCNDSDQNIRKFAQTIFTKNMFKTANIDNCVFNNIFRVNEKINGQDILINYLANFYVTNRVDLVNGKSLIKEILTIDFDINTFVDENYLFDINAVKDFFTKSTQMSKEYLDFFFS